MAAAGLPKLWAKEFDLLEIDRLQIKISSEIPILKEMGMEIRKVEKNESLIHFPLQPNHNHKGTAFGGSIYAACTAACYALIYSRQIQSQIADRDLVITQGEIKYKKAVKQDFFARAELVEPDWQSLLESLKNRRPEKLMMTCFIYSGSDEINCEFTAHFALLPSDRR